MSQLISNVNRHRFWNLKKKFMLKVMYPKFSDVFSISDIDYTYRASDARLLKNVTAVALTLSKSSSSVNSALKIPCFLHDRKHRPYSLTLWCLFLV